ncbi:MAG: hypothetical protein ACYC5N_11025 [Endomicrobiales bacterium]
MHKPCLFFLSAALMLGTLSSECFADRRSYVWTYEYMTMLPGRWELETYVTSQAPDLSRPGDNTVRTQLELEYGITPDWDVAVYQTVKFKDAQSRYDGTKLRTRYKPGPRGRFPVDTLLYAEYIRDNDHGEPDRFEGKLVLAKDAGRFNISYNQVLETSLDGKWKSENGYALGVKYRLTPRFNLAVESKGNYSQEQFAAGPTVSYFGKGYYLSLGSLRGLNDRTDDAQTRFLAGILF